MSFSNTVNFVPKLPCTFLKVFRSFWKSLNEIYGILAMPNGLTFRFHGFIKPNLWTILISHCKYGQFYWSINQNLWEPSIGFSTHNSIFMTKWSLLWTPVTIFQPLKEGLSPLSASVDTQEGRLQDHFGRITICIIWLKFTKFCSDNLIIEK